MPDMRILIAAVVATCATANAQLIRHYEFNVDGVLPSTEDPEVTFCTGGGGLDRETIVFSVSGGVLFLDSTPNGILDNPAYVFPSCTPMSPDITPCLPLSLETRMRATHIAGPIALVLRARDGAHTYTVRFTPGGANLATDTGDVFVELDDMPNPAGGPFHVYRIETDGPSGEWTFVVDGTLRATVPSPATNLAGFQWSGGAVTPGIQSSGDGQFDYIRFDQIAPEQPCDLDVNGIVDVNDLLRYLALWFDGEPCAEFDALTNVEVGDLLAYLSCWFG